MWFDRHRPRKRLPLGREISAVARALHAFEDKAVPYVAELLESKQADARFAATLLCNDLVRPALVWPLYKRLFDPDGQVRLIALETLPAYRNVAGWGEVLKSLRERALDELETPQVRLSAVEALGALRDPGSVEVLVRLSEHPSRQLSVPARRSLIAITGQELENERKWRTWLDKNKARHRVEWLIDGLMHAEERVRATAAIELQKLTQVYYGFEASAGKREREQAQTRYRNWWLIEGKRTFG
jgi:HEAT repeat protein